MQQRTIQHLLWRAGFGPTIQQLKKYQGQSRQKVVRDLLQQSNRYEAIDEIPKQLLDQMRMAKDQMMHGMMSSKKELRELSKQRNRAINLNWLGKMVNSSAQLREKMALFWHDHFACKEKNAYFTQLQINTLRKYALGNFGELLMAVAKDPAMLKFLNNRQNKKASPNENFARELLELFTLGIGNYTEKDIKEAARAFTGWNFDKEGKFVIRQFQHDDGRKTFMGRSGNFGGEDIIMILLDNQQTAYYITKKIYQYLVNEEADERIIQQLTKHFYQSNYNISSLIEKIFMADWFYTSKNIGSQIKSPIIYLAGLQRLFQINFPNPSALLRLQKALGQQLLEPPNVAGWTGGKAWIDSTTLTYRLGIPSLIFQEASTNIPNMAPRRMNKQERFQATFDARDYYQWLTKSSKTDMTDSIAQLLIQVDIGQEQKQVLDKYRLDGSTQTRINGYTLTLLSMPEYQLC